MYDLQVLLDLDGTVLNTARLRCGLFKVTHLTLKERGATLDVIRFQEHMKEMAGQGTDVIDALAMLVPDHLNGSAEGVLRARATNVCHNMSRYLYADGMELLAKLKQLEHEKHMAIDVRVITYGHPDWQRFKLDRCGLGIPRDKIHITRELGAKAMVVADLMSNARRTLYVDDSTAEVLGVRARCPQAQSYLLMRSAQRGYSEGPHEDAFWKYEERWRYPLPDDPAVAVITSLSQLTLEL